MKACYMILVALLSIVGSARGQNGVIFISPCGENIPPFQTKTFLVSVCIEGAISGGIRAAEFRIAGLPSTWVAVVHPVPSASSYTGDLFAGGGRIEFATCQRGDRPPFLDLFTVDITALDASNDVLLYATASTPPGDPNFDCAVVQLCDEPALTRKCVFGFGSIINGVTRFCGLPVASHTWSEIKKLYD